LIYFLSFISYCVDDDIKNYFEFDQKSVSFDFNGNVNVPEHGIINVFFVSESKGKNLSILNVGEAGFKKELFINFFKKLLNKNMRVEKILKI
jgi:hypothetical protein